MGDLTGDRVVDDRFALSRELGRGATGTVWEATDLATSEVVAIKILHPHLFTSALARRRFHREMKSASSLRHQNMIAVASREGATEQTAYLVMERLWGTTLSDLLRQAGPLPQARALKIIAQVLDAVGAAHSRSLVHRDLKPANVMLVERDGDRDFVKVCDFGLAKLFDREGSDRSGDGHLSPDLDSMTTETGSICGTPEYMPPEQARGEVVDARADLYAVAAMLYHAVVGRVPFSGRSALAVLSLQTSAPPPRPRSVRPDLDIFPPLESLILRGLAKDRAERPSSAEVFRSDLLQIGCDYIRRQHASKSVTHALPLTETPTLSDPRIRHGRPRVLRWGAIVAATLALTATGILAQSKLPDQARATPLAAHGPGAAKPATSDRFEAREMTPGGQQMRVSAAVPRRARRAVPVKGRAVEMATSPAPAKDQGAVRVVRQAEQVLGLGRIAAACAIGLTAPAAGPRESIVWEFLGRCYMRLGQPDEARAYYRKYLAVAAPDENTAFVRAIVGDDQGAP